MPETFVNIILFLPGFLLAIVVHEFSHAWMANQLGDPTARMLGRLSLNPLRHIDPWGTIVLPLMLLWMSQGRMVFGYAKPVPITGENFKHPRRDHLWVALAGPCSNVLLAALLILIGWGARWLGWMENPGLRQVMQAGVQVSVVLAAFNLIPLPPLDGSEILMSVLPAPWAYRFSRIMPYSFVIMMGLYVTGVLNLLMVPIYLFIQLLLSPFGNPF